MPKKPVVNAPLANAKVCVEEALANITQAQRDLVRHITHYESVSSEAWEHDSTHPDAKREMNELVRNCELVIIRAAAMSRLARIHLEWELASNSEQLEFDMLMADEIPF